MIKVWMTSHDAPLYDLPFGFGSIVHHHWWREIKGVKVQWSFLSLLVCFLTFSFSRTEVIGYTWLIWLYITHKRENNNDGLALFRGCRGEKSKKNVLVSILSLSLICIDAWVFGFN
jgi:hypothetical protein